MKIVYDDIIYSLQRAGGISLYWSQLETQIEQNVRLLYPHYKKNIFFPAPKGIFTIKRSNSFWERYKKVSVLDDGPFIFHSSYYRYCRNKNAINITTVHDFIYEYFRHDLRSIIHKMQKKMAIEKSKAIIFNSENTKKDFTTFFPNYKGIKKVIYLGLSEDYHHINLARKNVVIYIGGRTGYKNFFYAIEILKKLPHYILQIVGGGALTTKELSALNTCIPDRYEYYQLLSNHDLNIKYNEAKFLLFPSLYEGFGIPILEAQAAGCPVVCCKVSSLPEVAGDAAVYITGKDIDEDIKKVLLLENHDYYKSIVKAGFKNHKKFSWRKCAKETYNLYEEVYRLVYT
jgi:mannosyltransferase